MTPDELYHLGTRLFDEGRSAESRRQLAKLFDELQHACSTACSDDVYREAARMLLRAAIAAKDNDAHRPLLRGDEASATPTWSSHTTRC